MPTHTVPFKPGKAGRTTVGHGRTSYHEPCADGPRAPQDALCAAHGLLTAPAGTNGWPTDLNNLGGRRLRAYTATNWFDVLEVLDWRTKTDPTPASHRGIEYAVVIDNGGQPVIITTDTIAFLDNA